MPTLKKSQEKKVYKVKKMKKNSGGTRSAVGEREEAKKKRKNIHAGIEVNQYLYKGPWHQRLNITVDIAEQLVLPIFVVFKTFNILIRFNHIHFVSNQ